MPAMHEIDYHIHGDDMQFVEIELDPEEAVVAEAGGMMFMEEGIEMETIFGDGSQQNTGFLGHTDADNNHASTATPSALCGGKRVCN